MRKQRKWSLNPGDWAFPEYLINTLAVRHHALSGVRRPISTQAFYSSTLDLSKKGVPTVCKMLPLYKHTGRCLKHHQTRAHKDFSPYNLDGAITLALLKLERYAKKALESDYPLLGAGESGCLFELRRQTRHLQPFAT